MTVNVQAAQPDSTIAPAIGLVSKARRRDIMPDGSRVLELDGCAALIYVRFGVLAIGGRSGARALPHEWLCVNGVARLHYANASRTEPLSVYELLFDRPAEHTSVGVQQRYISDDERADNLFPVVVGDRHNVAMTLGLDLSVYVTTLARWATVVHELGPGRCAFVWMLDGDGTVNSQRLESGGSATISDEGEVRIAGGSGADVMLLEAACDEPNRKK